MHRVAGVDDIDDFFGITINQRNLTGIAQCHGKDILDIVIVHLLLGTLLGRDQYIPGRLHLFHTELGRNRRLMLQVLGHEDHFIGGEITRCTPVRHAGR